MLVSETKIEVMFEMLDCKVDKLVKIFDPVSEQVMLVHCELLKTVNTAEHGTPVRRKDEDILLTTEEYVINSEYGIEMVPNWMERIEASFKELNDWLVVESTIIIDPVAILLEKNAEHSTKVEAVNVIVLSIKEIDFTNEFSFKACKFKINEEPVQRTVIFVVVVTQDDTVERDAIGTPVMESYEVNLLIKL